MTPRPTDVTPEVTPEVMRTVVDTNVVVSAALFPERTPGKAFKRARQRGVALLSLPLAEELRRVFRRTKFDRYVAPALRDEFLSTLIDGAKLVAVTTVMTVCRDPKDNMVLEAALAFYQRAQRGIFLTCASVSAHSAPLTRSSCYWVV